MLLHLVPYLINFCFSDAEEKQNKEGMIETNTRAQVCTRARVHTRVHTLGLSRQRARTQYRADNNK